MKHALAKPKSYLPSDSLYLGNAECNIQLQFVTGAKNWNAI